MSIIARFWFLIGKFPLAKFLYKKSRNFLLRHKLVEHSGRQRFLIGKLKKNKNKKDFKKYLLAQGFEPDPYAWIDDGEVLSLRKLDKQEYQYHLRLFKDGEVRGHYEYAPDRHPLKHYWVKGLVDRKENFKKILRGFLA